MKNIRQKTIYVEDASVSKTGNMEYFFIIGNKKIPLTYKDFKELGWLS